MREKLWYNLVNTKFQSIYLSLIVVKYQKYDRAWNIFLSLTSSGSIGAWAIWQEYEMTWAILIALSNVVNVLKPYFPFNKYVQELNGKSIKLETLHLDYEQLWHKYELGIIQEPLISNEFFSLKSKKMNILKIREDILAFEDKVIKQKADSEARAYLQNNY